MVNLECRVYINMMQNHLFLYKGQRINPGLFEKFLKPHSLTTVLRKSLLFSDSASESSRMVAMVGCKNKDILIHTGNRKKNCLPEIEIRRRHVGQKEFKKLEALASSYTR